MTGPSKAGQRLQHSIVELSRWTVRLLVIGVGLVALFWVMGQLWSILLPILFGLLLATILWPPVRLMRKKIPNALAAMLAILALIVVVGGLIAVLAPQVTSQAQSLVDRASAGLVLAAELGGRAALQPRPRRVGRAAGQGRQGTAEQQPAGRRRRHRQSRRDRVRRGDVRAGPGALLLLPQGRPPLPAVAAHLDRLANAGRTSRWWPIGSGPHSGSTSGRRPRSRWWTGCSSALGSGCSGVPFALPIAVLTFFGGFVPIVGAFVAGAIATLVALVSNGVWTAVAVLAIVLVVQQLEGNVMQPILVGRTLKIHAAVVLTSVALGGTLFGIVGAFLAVPAVAVFQVIARYVREQLAHRSTGSRGKFERTGRTNRATGDTGNT